MAYEGISSSKRQVHGSPSAEEIESFYDLSALDINKKEIKFDKYKGKVVMVMNVASKCGFTDAGYTQTQILYEKYKDQGFEVLAFPCNQFGKQEPGSNDDICTFARDKYGATFTLFDKIEVNGENTHPVYQYLKKQKNLQYLKIPVERIAWNFEKFLIDRNGQVVQRYKSNVAPESIEEDIVKLLDQKPNQSML